MKTKKKAYLPIKHFFDFAFALIMLIALTPVWLMVALLIYFNMGWPILFTQTRIGQYGKEFKIFKFRSMKAKSEKYDTDAKRVTSLGKFLRRSSLDEIPQLVNIILGDMSFLGPRPLLPDYMPYYTDEEMKRFELRPGMSGYAEIMGRQTLNWDEQLKCDVVYVEKISFSLDLKIFLTTIPMVLNINNVQPVGRFDSVRFDIHRQRQWENGTMKERDSDPDFISGFSPRQYAK